MFEHRKSPCTYVVLITMFAIGCGDDPSKPIVPDGPAMADAPLLDGMIDAPDATVPAPIEVRGTGSIRSITDTGIVETRRNFATATITSFTPTGSGAEFEQRTGSGAQGSFSVQVGPGASQWQLAVRSGTAPFVVVGNDQRLDLSLVTLGRPDAEVATRPTPVTINATGLAAWQFGDVLQVMSSNAGAFLVNIAVDDPPAPGDTALTGKLVA